MNTWPRCVILLAAAGCITGASQPTTVILVRHAEREQLLTPDPELSEAGRSRAEALASAAREAGVRAIIITQFVRTRETAELLANALGIMPEIVPDTGAGHAKDVANLILRKHAGQTVLVIGHGHTIPAIMRALGVRAPQPSICENQYDLIFLVSVAPPDSTRVLRARYGAATPADSLCLAVRR